jgi:hypothetical protein
MLWEALLGWKWQFQLGLQALDASEKTLSFVRPLLRSHSSLMHTSYDHASLSRRQSHSVLHLLTHKRKHA